MLPLVTYPHISGGGAKQAHISDEDISARTEMSLECESNSKKASVAKGKRGRRRGSGSAQDMAGQDRDLYSKWDGIH